MLGTFFIFVSSPSGCCFPKATLLPVLYLKEVFIMNKKMIAALLTLSVSVCTMAACQSGASDASGASSTNTSDTSQTAQSANASDTSGSASGESYTICITQYAQHGSLDNCREGFLEGLAQEGIVEGENLTIQYQNAQADSGMSSQIASQFVAEDPDLICAIATPSALSCYNAARDTDIPVIYTAVTDPLAAELVDENQMPVGNVTGTSDKLPVDAQLELIRSLLPDATTIGIMYTTSELNSVATIEEYKEKAPDYGFEIVDVGISTSADIPLAADNMLTKVDCVNNLTDNTVVQGLPTILAKAAEQNIPVFGSEIEQVKIGCLAAAGIDYIELGKKTGQMAAQILRGEATASEMPYETFENYSTYFNQAVADNLGLTVDSSLWENAEIFTEITEE